MFVLVGEMLEVVVSAFLDFLYYEPFQSVELAHYKSQVVAFHLCANVFLNGVDFHKEHGEELIFRVQTVHNHRSHILQNKVLFISKVVNAVNGSACECGYKVVEVKILVISTEVGFDEFEHFGEDAVDFFHLLLLVFFFKDFILEATGFNHGDFPHFDHGDSLTNKFDVFDGELIGVFAKEVKHTHKGLADNFLFVDDHLK